MKLYFSPGACSFAPHIALREAQLSFALEPVDLATKRTRSGADYAALVPKNYVPALELDDGSWLTELAAILQFIADRNPAASLAPPPASFERYRLQEWLHFIGNELHKNLGAFFNTHLPEAMKPMLHATLQKRLDLLEKTLGSAPFLLGEGFSVADAYLFTVLRWTKFAALDLAKWPHLTRYVERVKARPSVLEAIAAEKAATA